MLMNPLLKRTVFSAKNAGKVCRAVTGNGAARSDALYWSSVPILLKQFQKRVRDGHQ